jgi:dUTP pyrophosphatase
MKWIKLKDDAIIPTRATIGSAGYDLCSNETIRLMPNEVKLVSTGITWDDVPENWVGFLNLRSSIALKRGLIEANGTGIIDSTYRDEIKVMVKNMLSIPCVIDYHERIAQITLVEYKIVPTEKKVTKKRTGGFGSTNEEE